MKKLFLSALVALSFTGIAQEKKEKFTTGLVTEFSNFANVGVAFEFKDEKDVCIVHLFNSKGVLNNHFSNGITIEAGVREYIKSKKLSKFYYDNLLGYSNVKFKDSDYSGTYEVITPINISLGYKAYLTNNFIIETYIGSVYNVEIKSRGDVDNKDFKNDNLKFGFKFLYQF